MLANELEAMRPGAEKFLKALPPGSVIKTEGGDYKVLSFLGDGFEGSVYAAAGPLGKKTVKIFKGTTDMRSQLKELESMADEGVPTPKIWSVDETNQVAVLDYVEGLAVNKLLSPTNQTLTATERNQIQTRLDAFKRLVLPHWPKFKEQNIVMDFNTGEFYVVDAT